MYPGASFTNSDKLNQHRDQDLDMQSYQRKTLAYDYLSKL